MARGMRKIRESYDVFEKAMAELDEEEVPGLEPGDNLMTGALEVREEGESSNVAGVEPTAAPVAEPGPYMGWAYGGNYV